MRKPDPDSQALSKFLVEKAAPGFEPGNGGFADLCLSAWLCRHDLEG